MTDMSANMKSGSTEMAGHSPSALLRSLIIGLTAFLTVVAGYSPNAYVVDVDRETREVLLHDLVPRRESERPA